MAESRQSARTAGQHHGVAMDQNRPNAPPSNSARTANRAVAGKHSWLGVESDIPMRLHPINEDMTPALAEKKLLRRPDFFDHFREPYARDKQHTSSAFDGSPAYG